METPGQWLERALLDLCKQVKTGLDLDKDIISGLVSYCDFAQPVDAKEYLDNIIGREAGKGVIDEYLRRRGYSDPAGASNVRTTNLHAYVKPPSAEVPAVGARKAPRQVKDVAASSGKESSAASVSNESKPSNQSTSRKKKAGKVVSLAEAAKGSIVFQQGRPCSCQARRHRLVSNCLSCGKIVCEQEGEGPCNFCGSLVLKEGSKYAGLEETVPVLSEAEVAAEAYAKRLVEYDRNSAARTTVIDDQSDYYEIEGNSWLSKEEKELLRKKQDEIEEAERAKRNKVIITFDLVGRKVLLNEDEVSAFDSGNGILQPPDEREVNRIKPNPTLKVQPIFVDPGPQKKATNSKAPPKKTRANGLCLEITGRVQRESNELKQFKVDNHSDEENVKFSQGVSVNSSSHVEDDTECSLDYY
ncbi:activating signal cointegrator 1 [Punica granatum]|uniref:Uncharacterized protein n=2 Tax=Punica granatum TaxID=22663 RepID=A0A218VY09_PUNGR|nr:activating signal cointegrator 1 [Punica granatum]OWM65306.1 hypothetical protein CDL15_Pgr008896 [Punica granatum]PKI63244.1 hypothetical protein CRG98_016429 [Punica granatum]